MSSQEEPDEQDLFIEKGPVSACSSARIIQRERFWRLLAVSSLVLFFIQTVWVVYEASTKPGAPNCEPQSYRQGFDTDLDTFTSSIKTIKRRFTGALHPGKNGDMVLVQSPDEPKFVGEPKEEVDRNWDDLIAGRYFRFSDEEQQQLDIFARQDGSQTSTYPITEAFNALGTYGGLDMFHSLHCLNALRKALDETIVMSYQNPRQDFTRLHHNHCIEQLRQAILCHGDLTPVTLTPVHSGGSKILNLVGQTEYEHTCRDWRRFRTLLDGRESLNLTA